MDLKVLAKKYIVETVLKHGHTKNTWRLMIIDELTSSILAHLFTKSEFIDYDLANINRFENEIRGDFKTKHVIYFIYLTDPGIKRIKADIKNQKFARYTLFTINEPTTKQQKKIDELFELEFGRANINFQVMQKNVVLCEFCDLGDLAETFAFNFDLYSLGESEDIKDLESKIKAPNGKKADLIVINRNCDLCTPLVRFFTFMSFANDLGYLQNTFYKNKNFEFENFDMFNTVKDIHVAEVNPYLHERAKELNKELASIDKANTEELKQMVMQLHETMDYKKELESLLCLLSDCMKRFKEENMNKSSLFEQSLAIRHGNVSSEFSSYLAIINDDNVSMQDKFRIYLLMSYCGHTFTENEEKQLLTRGIIRKNDRVIKDKLKALKSKFVKTKVHKYKYENSKYKPLVYSVLTDFLADRKDKHGLKRAGVGKTDVKFSLRKTEFVFQKSIAEKNRKCVFVYIHGGVCYEEISIINLISKSTGAEIYIGSNIILSFDSFVEMIKNSK